MVARIERAASGLHLTYSPAIRRAEAEVDALPPSCSQAELRAAIAKVEELWLVQLARAAREARP